MVNAEYEYVALHRDVGETELKQGREIREGGSLVYVDSATVRAVKAGRILIIEGIEKAERGIMPVCSNLRPCPSFSTHVVRRCSIICSRTAKCKIPCSSFSFKTALADPLLIETSTTAHISSTPTGTCCSLLPTQLTRVSYPPIGPSASSPLAHLSRLTPVTRSIRPFVHASKHASSTRPARSSRTQTRPAHFLRPPLRFGRSYAISCSQRNTRARHATYSTASLAQRSLDSRRRRWPSCTPYSLRFLPRPRGHRRSLRSRHALWEGL